MLTDGVMHRLSAGLFCGVILFLSACGQKEPALVAVPEIDASALEHERLFGAEAKAADITWRSSGLGIRILAQGEGPAPKMTDTIRVHYVGRLKDGQVFDDSHARGKPSDFVVNYLITGWAAAMPTLKAGGHAVFFIPPVLGYGGVRSAGIPPNSGLIFDVELIAVNPETAPKP
jgi:FKBP-type peptidyl-prolyl cis-trans isomerase